jgi:HEAT repeat protein
VDAFRGQLAGMQETIGLIRRHESEMLSLQQKFSELSAEVGALGSVLASMEETQRNQSAVHAPAAAPQAPWLGILPQLESTVAGDRWTAVQQLGETRDPAVADYLTPLLKDTDIFVRMATARVLGDLGAPRATPALIDALEDAEFPVREAAYVALVAVSKRNLPFDAMADPAERAKRVKAWRDWWKKEGGAGA